MIYLIIAVSFALMYSINYTKDIIWSIVQLCNIFDIDHTEFLSPIIFYTVYFLASFILFPIFCYAIFKYSKYEIIKVATYSFMKEYVEIDDE